MIRQINVDDIRIAREEDGLLKLIFEYNPELIADIKLKNKNEKIRPTGTKLKWRWDSKAKCWTCPDLPENRQLLKTPEYNFKFEGEGPEFKIDPKEKPWLNIELDVIGANGLKPWDYQYECLQFLMWRGGRGILGLDMALGKSVIAALFCKLKRDHVPAIIMCPSTLKLQWAKYWADWVGTPVKILNGRTGYPLEQGMNYIINWDILAYTKKEKKKIVKNGRTITKENAVVQKDSWFHFIKSAGFKTLIADEIQFCSNSESMRGASLINVAKSIKYFIPLSGTPIKTKPSQFWVPLHLCDETRFPRLRSFKLKYCNIEHNGFGEQEKPGCKDPAGLYEGISNVMIRYKKADVLKDLPEKNRIVVPLEIDRKKYDAELAIFKQNIKTIDRSKVLDMEHAIADLMSSAFDLKKPAVMKWLNDWLEINPGKKLVIFGWHRVVVEFIHECYKDISVLYYGGSTTKQKQSALHSFLNDPSVLFFIGNAQSAGTGLDGMQNVCNECCFVEGTQSPADSDQAEDRLLRPGQKNSVTAYYLPANDTIDMDIIEMWDIKRRMIDQIVDGKMVTDDDDLLQKLFDKYSTKQTNKGGMF